MAKSAAVKIAFCDHPKRKNEHIIHVDLPKFFKSFRMTREGHRLLDNKRYVTEKLGQFERNFAEDMTEGRIELGPFSASYDGFHGLCVGGHMYEFFGVMQAVRDGRIPRGAVREFPLRVPRPEVRQFARFQS
jgi:hypothetical protein